MYYMPQGMLRREMIPVSVKYTSYTCHLRYVVFVTRTDQRTHIIIIIIEDLRLKT